MNPLEQFEQIFQNSRISESDTMEAMQKHALEHGRAHVFAGPLWAHMKRNPREQLQTFRTEAGALLLSETHHNSTLPDTAIQIATMGGIASNSEPKPTNSHILTRRIVHFGEAGSYPDSVVLKTHLGVSTESAPQLASAQLQIAHLPSNDVLQAIWHKDKPIEFGDKPATQMLRALQIRLQTVDLRQAIMNLSKDILQTKWLPQNNLNHHRFIQRFAKSIS